MKNKEHIILYQLVYQSAIGRFHQGVLGGVHGFKNHDAGYDIENKQRKIIAEIKNKYNTMNAPKTEVQVYQGP